MTRAIWLVVGVGLAVAMATGAGWAAVAAEKGGAASAVEKGAAAASVLQDPEPLLYDDTVVRELSLTVPSSDWQTLLGCTQRTTRPGSTAVPRTDREATLVVDGTELEGVGVRCKGNSSLTISGTKKPLNITTDSFVDGQEIWGFDVINLNNGWSDPSLLREAMALRFMREYQPVSRFSFARVTMNGRYLGLYAMVEQINGEWSDAWYPEDGGTIIKGDSPDRIAFNSSTLNWKGESLDTYKRGYEAKGKAAGTDAAYVLLREFIRALDAPASAGGPDAAAFPERIRQVLDVESALWYLATSNLLANFDSYYVGKNYYLYRGQRDPRFHLVPWDLGLSFGLFQLQTAQGPGRPGEAPTTAAQADPFIQSSEQNRPLIRRLLAVPSFRADYVAHYRAMLDETFTPEWIESTGARYQDLIKDAVREEATVQGRIGGVFTYSQFLTNLREPVGGSRLPGQPVGPGMGGAPGLLALVNDRRAHLATLGTLRAPDVRLTEQGHHPVEVTTRDRVAVHAAFEGVEAVATVELRYRIDGGFEHVVEAVRDGQGVWRATIPAAHAGAVVSYVWRAGLEDGSAAFFPTATLTRPYTYRVVGITLPRAEGGPLVINEIMADNDATAADEAGEFDDWLELTNRGDAPVDLAGHFLSDKADDPYAFALPAMALAPGEHVVVWCDNDTEQGDRHAPFRLDADGESVYLATRDAVVDSVTFPGARTDEAYMRLPDGAETWVACAVGTPNRANACAPGQITTPVSPGTPGTSVPTVPPTPIVPGTPTAPGTPPAPGTPVPTGSPGTATTPAATPTTPGAPHSPTVPSGITGTPVVTPPPGPAARALFLPWAWR